MTNFPFVAVSISNVTGGTELVDPNGDVILARVFYSLELPLTAPDTAFLILQATGLTDINQSFIDPAILFVDETVVEIIP